MYYKKGIIRENIKTLPNDLNGRISREIGVLLGDINSQIQRAVEEAISNQVLLQVQNILKDVQSKEAPNVMGVIEASCENSILAQGKFCAFVVYFSCLAYL